MAEGGFVVRGEIDAEFRSEAEYSDSMREWFEGALRDLFPDELGAILSGPPLDPKGMRGGPLGVWAAVSPTLRPGLPQRFERYPTDPPLYVVYEDARDATS